MAWALVLTIAGCGTRGGTPTDEPPEKLSQYALFVGNGSTQQPAAGVIPYDLNTPLFSDYAEKFRFVKLPPGQALSTATTRRSHFPSARSLPRHLPIRPTRESCRWVGGHRDANSQARDGWLGGVALIWNAEQTEATLELAGDMVDVKWVDSEGGQRTNNYIIPNANQCKGCHKLGDELLPIGPKARHLNRDFAYAEGTENQLTYWTRAGFSRALLIRKTRPRLAVWNDPHSGTLDQRCGPGGVACAALPQSRRAGRNTGLDLMAGQQVPTQYGIFKTPVAAGRGSGGYDFDIVPGQPDKSILMFRITSTDPGIMMPELGKRLIHDERRAGSRVDRLAACPALPSGMPP